MKAFHSDAPIHVAEPQIGHFCFRREFPENFQKGEQKGAEWCLLVSGYALGSLKLLFKKIALD